MMKSGFYAILPWPFHKEPVEFHNIVPLYLQFMLNFTSGKLS